MRVQFDQGIDCAAYASGDNFREDVDYINFYDKVLQRLNAVPGGSTPV